jgi:hypothetical protein
MLDTHHPVGKQAGSIVRSYIIALPDLLLCVPLSLQYYTWWYSSISSASNCRQLGTYL